VVKKAHKMKAEIGVTGLNLKAVANELNVILADENVLYIKTKNAHWNVEGPDFYDKHKFFESQFGQLDEIIDKVAERIRTIGHFAAGTLKLYLELTQLTEVGDKNTSQGYIKELLMDHETIIIRCRENIHRFADEYKDAGSSDFVTGIMEEHEKMAWFLRSHLD
jgi:starvation-inducible DNA-binding protein